MAVCHYRLSISVFRMLMLSKLLFLLTLLNMLLSPIANSSQLSVLEGYNNHSEHKMMADNKQNEPSTCLCPSNCCETSCTHCACAFIQLPITESQIRITYSYQMIPTHCAIDDNVICNTLPPELPPPLV